MAFAISLICRKTSMAIAPAFRKDHLTKNTRTNMSDSVCNCTRTVHRYRRHLDGVILVQLSKILCTAGLKSDHCQSCVTVLCARKKTQVCALKTCFLCMSVCLCVGLIVCPSVCPSVCLSVCLSVRLSVGLYVRLSVCSSVLLSLCLIWLSRSPMPLSFGFISSP